MQAAEAALAKRQAEERIAEKLLNFAALQATKAALATDEGGVLPDASSGAGGKQVAAGSGAAIIAPSSRQSTD